MTFPMENPNTNTNRPATPAEPAADGFRDSMEVAADSLEADIVAASKEAGEMSVAELVALLKETSDYHNELADTACDLDSAQDCRVQSAAIWRAAEMLEKLANEGGIK